MSEGSRGESEPVDPAFLDALGSAASVSVTPEAAPVENPLGGPFHFNLSVPEVEVRMVDASALSDYEIWMFAASAVLSGMVGFVVGYIQSFRTVQLGGGRSASVSSPGLLIMAVLLLLLFAVFFVRALVIRHRLHGTGTTYRMRATEAKDPA